MINNAAHFALAAIKTLLVLQRILPLMSLRNGGFHQSYASCHIRQSRVVAARHKSISVTDIKIKTYCNSAPFPDGLVFLSSLPRQGVNKRCNNNVLDEKKNQQQKNQTLEFLSSALSLKPLIITLHEHPSQKHTPAPPLVPSKELPAASPGLL